MSLSLAELPLWICAIFVVLLPTALAMCGPLLVRRRFALERLTTNNEIAGFKFATVGVIYAVLLAFAIIIVWERFSDAEGEVVHEASASATLYRLAAGDEPDVVSVRGALTNYLTLAIAQDWPQMAHEKESYEVNRALNGLYTATLHLAQGGSRQMPVVMEMFSQLDQITQARRTRLHLAHGIVPTVLWVVLLSGGVLTIAFTFFFGTRNLQAQMLMTGILSLIVFMGLFVIVAIDHPFTGTVHIHAQPLELVLEDFAQAGS